ncbi:MAG TPA: FG-GAP-like repeat-containing protein [Gemmatimonadales bacterium]|nr:FG-GAP-like repeat-containing protein [Gemmatimonadales bacterium]
MLPPLERRITAIPIADSTGRHFALPFLGGLERPRPQLVDIDGDGDLDLFIQEYTGRMTFFERSDSAGTPSWTWRTDRWEALEIGDWSRFIDLDGDGDQDVLSESPYSFIRWYRNDGTPQKARFTLAADTLYDVKDEPIFADRQNIPQLGDLDCNGRIDLMLGRVDGTITRFELRGIEGNAPRFGFVTDRFEGIQILGGDATPGGPPPMAIPGAGGITPSLHGANTMALVDLDRDADLDILWGDFFEPGLLWIRNNGGCSSPSMREAPVPFPVGNPLRTSGYNAPTPGDLDGDGDLDFLVGVLGGAYNPTRTARDNLYLVEQTTPAAFEVRTTRFLDGFDLGSESSPTLFDLDADGDLDMLVGNKIEPEGEVAGLYLLENVGSAKAPAFRVRSQLPVAPGYHYAPALGDLDADGDADLVLGTWRDALLFYRNDGSRTSPRFVLADSMLARLTRGSHATPTLGDLDGDGDLDLFVGEASGAINQYRNDGNRSAPRFTLVTDAWNGLQEGRRTAPRLADVDGDEDLDLVIGTESGTPVLFRNTGSAKTAEFARVQEAPVWPALSVPAFGDLDGDGDLDAVLGNAAGGLMLFEGVARGRQ